MPGAGPWAGWQRAGTALSLAVLAWVEVRVDPGQRFWVQALRGELDDIEGGLRRLLWALGGLRLLLFLPRSRARARGTGARSRRDWLLRPLAVLLDVPPDLRLAQRPGTSMRPILVRALLVWVPTVLAGGLVLLGAEEMVRGSIRDSVPPVQLLVDAQSQLNAGVSPTAVVPPERVDMASSVDPYVMVFDRDGRLLASSVELHGRPPSLPPGVFESVRCCGRDDLTWQPEPGVYGAVSVDGWNHGFVLVGQSDRLIVERERRVEVVCLVSVVALAGVMAVVALLIGVLHPMPSSGDPAGRPSQAPAVVPPAGPSAGSGPGSPGGQR